jgi:uncharacterized cupin superfamily protein
VTDIVNILAKRLMPARGGACGKYSVLQLGGAHIGCRVEELAPGSFSSRAHYHTLEEEHVFVLAGHATLHLGKRKLPLAEGDHVCFEAGVTDAHTIENTSGEPFRFLVFGERKQGDVVIYPHRGEMLVKAVSPDPMPVDRGLLEKFGKGTPSHE